MNVGETADIAMILARLGDDGNDSRAQVGPWGMALSKEPPRNLPVPVVMRLALAILLPIALAACDKAADSPDASPSVTANISDRTEKMVQDSAPPANATSPVETASNAIAADADMAGPVPTALQGRWTGLNDRCGDRAADKELNILPDQLVFHESVGTVQKATPGEDGRLSVTAAFTGEGQSWTRTMSLALADDGQRLIIVNDGTSATRKRC